MARDLEQPLALRWQFRLDLVQEQRDLVEQGRSSCSSSRLSEWPV
jgi:hypothetical protein